MLNRWLRTVNAFDRFGVAGPSFTGPFAVLTVLGWARFTAAGVRLRTNGLAARTNGRIWLRRIGVAGPASCSVATFAAGIACTAGIRFRVAGATMSANRWTFWRVTVVWLSVAGRSATAR